MVKNQSSLEALLSRRSAPAMKRERVGCGILVLLEM